MALRRIALRDFVIVQALDLDLHAGFTVLTGETGAGKSILIDALQLLLGARADTGVIREGAERTDICAEFDAGPTARWPPGWMRPVFPRTTRCCCAGAWMCKARPRLDQQHSRHGGADARAGRASAGHPDSMPGKA